MLDWSVVANWLVAILVPATAGLIGFALHLQRELNDLKVKVATDYSGLPEKVDRMSEAFESFRHEFQREFLPILYRIQAQLDARGATA